MTQSRVYRMHFIGIGGIGMSGIAEIFLSQGHRVSGSDLSQGETTERLVRMGATVHVGHAREHLPPDADVVVTSSAVKTDNPEVIEARTHGIPVIPRAEMLAEIMRGKTGIAVAGTHGKTTTTSMAAQILITAGMDPTVVVGGKVEAIGSNAKMGQGTVTVVEADESDGSFHLLPATHAVITNVDLDHMEYYGTREKLNEAFIRFTKQLPFYGMSWLCIDDAGVKEILPFLTKPYRTYGFSDEADLQIRDLKVVAGGKQSFELWLRPDRAEAHALLGPVTLAVLGRHNVLNSTGAVGVALSAGAPFLAAQEALQGFRHVRRRFDLRYESPTTKIRVVDDYGHHPTEIRAVLETARQAGAGRIVTVFQPHRYTRTQLCWEEFLTCFHETDVLLMLPIYAASEEPIEGVSTSALIRAIRASLGFGIEIHEVETLEAAEEWVLRNRQADDLILTLGAGSITRLAERLAHGLAETH